MKPMIEKKYGAASDELISLFKKAYPNKNITDLLVLDSMARIPTIDFALKKSVYMEAPTYLFLFSFEFPYDDGKPAWHCAEIPFVFHNAAITPICNIPDVTDKLEDQVCGAWVSFARSGNPNLSEIPDWSACKPDDAVTMVFDTPCEVKHNYDKELVEMHTKVAPPMFLVNDDDIVLH